MAKKMMKKVATGLAKAALDTVIDPGAVALVKKAMKRTATPSTGVGRNTAAPSTGVGRKKTGKVGQPMGSGTIRKKISGTSGSGVTSGGVNRTTSKTSRKIY